MKQHLADKAAYISMQITLATGQAMTVRRWFDKEGLNEKIRKDVLVEAIDALERHLNNARLVSQGYDFPEGKRGKPEHDVAVVEQ